MKSNLRLVVIIVAGVAIVILILLAARGGLRYYALNKVLKLPHARARLAVQPTKRTLAASPPIRPINLGYASFDTGTTNLTTIEATVSGVAVLVSNRDISIAILPPFGPEKAVDIALGKVSAGEARSNPHTLAFIKKFEANQMAAEMSVEEIRMLSVSRIFLMNSDDFLAYSLSLAMKVGNRFGLKEIQFIESPYAKGIVRIGESTNDTGRAAVFLASSEGTRMVGLVVRIPKASSRDLSHSLDPILRSFQFTAERVDDRERIKALIRAAGIPQRSESHDDMSDDNQLSH